MHTPGVSRTYSREEADEILRRALAAQASDGISHDDLVAAIASRVELDVRRVTLTFDPELEADRERIGRVYRHGTVIEHEVRDGRVTLVADLPRRLLGWFDTPAR